MNEFTGWFLKAEVFGAPLPDLAKFTGFIAAGLLLGRILRLPIARWLEHLTPETDHTTSIRVGRSIERSVFLLVFAVVLKSGAIDVLHLPGWAWEKFHQAITIFIAVAATSLFLQVVEIVLYGLRRKWSQDAGHQVDDHLIGFMRRGIRIFVILIAVLVTADNIGFRVGGALTGLGIGGAALALAAQGVIANLLGTIEVVADKLFRIGDRIHFDVFDGFVTEIGLRSTRLRALSGEELIIPNKKMAEVQIRNFSRNGLVRTTVSVGLLYSSTHDQVGAAMRALDEIFKARQDVESHQVYLKNLGAYSLELDVIFWARYTTSVGYNTLIGEVNLEIKRRFDQAGIEFAFPTQTLHVSQVGEPAGETGISAVSQPARRSPP